MNYIKILEQCFPNNQAYVVAPGIAENYDDLIWLTDPVDKATLDASPCALNPMAPVDINSNNPNYPVYATGAGVGFYYGTIPFKSGTTEFTDEDAVPPITEGTEIWSFTLTPQSETSVFSLFSSMQVDKSRSGPVVIALFRDSVCIGATTRYCSGSDKPGSTSILFTDRPETTNEVTYSARIGKLDSSGTWYINRSKSYTLGDSMQQHFIILENE